LDFISFMQLLRSRQQQPHRDSGETRLRRLLLSSELQLHSCRGAHPVGFAVFDNLCYKTPYRLCAQQTNRKAHKLNTNLQETLSLKLLVSRRLLPLPSLLLTTQLPHQRRKKLVQGMMMEYLPIHVDILAIGKMSFAEIASVQEMHSWTSRCCGVMNGNLASDRRCSQQEGIPFALLPIGLPQPR
jgi:hypothetical protein